MNIRKLLFTALLCVVSQLAMSQGARISGTVSDNDGPIMMGSVVERDANNRIISATQTDFNGNFSMQVKSTKNKLVFSYVGDKPKTVNIGSQTVFKIKLEPVNTTLKEVTVKGRRGNSGGLMIQKKEISVSQQTMNMEQVEGLAFTSADEALQGEIAGLDIVSNSGNLGSGTQMRLRGVSTLTGNANPLIVVDDKIFDNPDENFDFANADEEQYSSLLSVNVEDIQSITVLKDAAATAIWGSRGTNGVIQITTKRGSRGKPHVNFSYKFTGTWQPSGYDLLNGDDYTMMLKEEFYNPAQRSDATAYMPEIAYERTYKEYENWNNNTDWVKAVQQFGSLHDINFNISGGGQKATFRISAGYKNQSGTIIKQKLEQFTTRLALDYNVSDRIRFITNFALTYTNNVKNNESNGSLLGIAQTTAPNMAIYRQDANGNDTGEYYLMNKPAPQNSELYDPRTTNYSAYYLSPIYNMGNPVAIANMAWEKDQTYRLNPDFTIKYEILGVDADKSRLTFNGRVDFDIFAESKPKFWPASLSNQRWDSSNYNYAYNYEYNSMKIGGRVELVFTPAFKNKDFYATALLRYEMDSKNSSYQAVSMDHMPNGFDTPIVDAFWGTSASGNGRTKSQRALFNGHFSYLDGRYSLGFSLTADGNSQFGPEHKWAYFPGVSVRWNVSDEPFMKWSKKVISILGLRGSWGLTGRGPGSDYLFFNTYQTGSKYGTGSSAVQITTLSGLKLDDLKWEKKSAINVGFNLGLLNDKFEVEFDYYYSKITDMLMPNVRIPSYTGFSVLPWANVGEMTNQGYELNFKANRFIKKGKFSVDFSFNIAQNKNLLTEMDESVLEGLNTQGTRANGRGVTWSITERGLYPIRVSTGAALGSIYGYRYKGVYQYTYDYLQNYRKENGLTNAEYESWINSFLASGKTAPVATDANGRVIMENTGDPKRLVYNYVDGSSSYKFQGGDVIYEDINHDGQINNLDIVYLGNSQPKVNGGFSFNFRYGQWTLKARFNFRFGNKIINMARMNLESMSNVYNQSSTVNYRWRKDGDDTPMPRAIFNTGYNWQESDRYVEDGGFLRFQNLQISYNFNNKLIKKWGLNKLQAYASMDNLYVWTRYSGVDPEITSSSAYFPAVDNSRTPRSKRFTVTLNLGF